MICGSTEAARESYLSALYVLPLARWDETCLATEARSRRNPMLWSYPGLRRSCLGGLCIVKIAAGKHFCPSCRSDEITTCLVSL